MRRILLACLVLAFAFSKSALSASAATPPTLLTATRSSTNLFELFLTYSSKMDGTNAYDPANYVIKLGKTTLNIVDGYAKSNEKLGSSSNVILRVDSPITMGANWVVSANANVTDTNGVAITATDLPVTTVEFLVDSGNFWWYADQGAYGMPNAMFYDNSWAQPDFDPSGGNFGSDFPRPTTFGTSGNFGLDWTLCCWDGVNDVVIPSTTYYFILRDAPKVTGDIVGGQFLLRLLASDGGIVWVNGREAYRVNMPASVINPVYTNYASSARPGTALPTTTVTIPSGAFAAGTNYIAVEVHTARGSTSAGFDFQLMQVYTNMLSGPIVFVTQPASTNVVEGTDANFSVQHQGNPPYTYEWYVNDVKVAGATSRFFTMPRVSATNNNARVYAKVKGGSGAPQVTSATATLTVTPDTTVPTLLSAVYDDTQNGIVVTFSERMALPAVTNVANWTVTNLAGAKFTFTSVSNLDDTFTSFLLSTPNTPDPSTRYLVGAKNLTDTAATPNKLATNVVATVSANLVLIDLNADGWDFYQKGTNPPVASTWMNKNYAKDANWETGRAVFYNSSNLNLPIEALPWQYLSLTDDSGNPLITHYFRKQFTLASTNGIKLNVRQLVDDGCVVYLNGQVAYTDNMPTGTITYTNLAAASVSQPTLKAKVLPLTNLVAGVNQLAIEVHQRLVSDTDVFFGMELSEIIPATLVTNIVNQKPVVVINAPAAGATVQQNAAVSVDSTVTDDGTITKVELFDGATLVGTDTTAPYSISYTAATTGAHTLKVVATDNGGLTGEATVAINVNAKPVVTITSPAANATPAFGTAVTFSATVVDDGTISKVEFFNGTTSLGVDTTAPYSLSFTPSVDGTQTLKAVATDNTGATGEATVTIKVGPPPQPKLTIAKSADGKNVNLSWPATPGYTLQVATKVGPVPDWTAVAGAGATSYSVPVSGITAPRYYRLFHP